MKTLTVRQVEDRTADLLAQKAKSKGMSMEAQVRSILRETALEWEKEQRAETGRELLERVRRRFADIDGIEDYAHILDTIERPAAPDPVTFD